MNGYYKKLSGFDWQSKGQGFDSPCLHKNRTLFRFFYFYVKPF